MFTRTQHIVLLAGVLLALAAPVSAQTGIVKGRVVGPDGKPIPGVVVVIESLEGRGQRQLKTDRRGEFIQIGLNAGPYKVTVTADKIGSASSEVRVRSGQTAEVNFALDPAAGGGASAAAEALKKLFQEGVELVKAGSHDAAIAKFEEAAAIVPNCFDCYYNIGFTHLQRKDEAKAEEAFKRALELNPNYAPALNSLATLYNNQKRFEEAAAMSARAAAAGGGLVTADAIYNQGVILWNTGNIKEARAKFEEALRLNPEFAPAHFQLGMAQLNEGQIQEAVASFETYLKLAPQGEFAAQATAMVAQLKKGV